MDRQQISEAIRAAFGDAEVSVSGDDGAHFHARVVSRQFEGQRPLARHRLVYAALGEAVGREIHALSLETLTPAEAASRPPVDG